MNSKAFTIVELLVVMLIAAILVAITIPGYFYAVRLARYAAAVAVMRAIAGEATEFRNEGDRYPADEVRNVAPEGVSSFPIVPQQRTPFGARYDYDSYQAGSFCWVQVVFFGEDNERQASQDRYEGTVGAIATIGDDRILVIAAGECDRI